MLPKISLFYLNKSHQKEDILKFHLTIFTYIFIQQYLILHYRVE